MKRSILNIGIALNRAEQKQISGGNSDQPNNIQCNTNDINTCPPGMTCDITAPGVSPPFNGMCVANGNGDPGSGGGGSNGICPHNVGQNCDSPV